MKRSTKAIIEKLEAEDVIFEDAEMAIVEEDEEELEEADESDDDEEESPDGDEDESDDDEEEDEEEDEDGDDDDDAGDEAEKDPRIKEAFHEEAEVYLEGISFEEDARALNEGVMGGALTEEEVQKVATILETVHKTKLRAFAEGMIDQLTELHESRLAMDVEAVEAYLTEKANDYLALRMEKWEEDNQVELQEATEVDAARTLFEDLSAALAKYGHSVTPLEEEVAEEMGALNEANETLTADLNEAYEALMEANAEILELKKHIVFLESTTGMTEMEIGKLKPFVEEIRADDLDSFGRKLGLVLEHVAYRDEEEDEDYLAFVEDFDHEFAEEGQFIFEDEETGKVVEEASEDENMDDKVKMLLTEMNTRR